MCSPRDGTALPSLDRLSHADWQFVIDCARDIQIVVRLLGLLAQRDLGIRSISMISIGEDAALALRVEGLSDHQAAIIVEKMRGVIGVTHATLTPR